MCFVSKRFFTLVSLLFLLLLSACGSATQAAHPLSIHTPIPTATQVPTPEPTPSVGMPVRLVVPSIGINASIENLGIASNGDMDTPQQSPWDDVGWYRGGPRPGEEGSAVINGHLDRPGGYPAVFWNLRNLRPGDEVQVVDALGKIEHFRVLRVVSYTPQAAPIQDIFGTTGGIYLNLITCTGTWIPAQHQTTLRLVVYTQLE